MSAMRKLLFVVILLLCIPGISGCRQSAQNSSVKTLCIGTYNARVINKSDTNTTRMIAYMMKELGVQCWE